MKRIVVGCDGSEVSARALELAVELAKARGLGLALVHVVPPYYLPAEQYAPVADLVERHRGWATKLLAGLTEQYRSQVPEIRAELRMGGPAEELARAAEDPEVVMVVVGRTGAGKVARLLLGSAADRLLHIVHRPLLLVP